jgi:hypothetical protein
MMKSDNMEEEVIHDMQNLRKQKGTEIQNKLKAILVE